MPWGQTVVRRREQASLSATRPLLPCDLALRVVEVSGLEPPTSTMRT